MCIIGILINKINIGLFITTSPILLQPLCVIIISIFHIYSTYIWHYLHNSHNIYTIYNLPQFVCKQAIIILYHQKTSKFVYNHTHTLTFSNSTIYFLTSIIQRAPSGTLLQFRLFLFFYLLCYPFPLQLLLHFIIRKVIIKNIYSNRLRFD